MVAAIRDGKAARPCMHRVLVIEPYVSGRRTLCTCIAELGHEALEVVTMEDVRSMATPCPADLVIASCDEDASRSLLDELRARDPGVPAVMLSTFARAGTQLPGGALVLVKPFTLDSLDRAIGLMSRPCPHP